tara:strand:- start:135 stop:443 length:309 start_codon:yes stop_codon:yes gene_type:complete
MAKEKEYEDVYFTVPAYKVFKIKAEDVEKVSKEKGIDSYEIFQRYWTGEYENENDWGNTECIPQEESDLYEKIIIKGEWEYGIEGLSYENQRDFVKDEVFKW